MEKYYADIAVGETLVSRGRTVTEADIVTWCGHTGDYFVLHTDADYAAGTRFGQRIAPGIMVYAFAAGLGVPPAAPAIVANLGADELRFVAPVFIGDTIHLEAEVLSREDRRQGGAVTLRWDAVNQNGVTVMTSRMSVLFADRRPA